jgi:hypothetical protein
MTSLLVFLAVLVIGSGVLWRVARIREQEKPHLKPMEGKFNGLAMLAKQSRKEKNNNAR